MIPDDEAFVRAIVDRPGDDLARLVYADWLDERGDPRGAYLRAEARWAGVRDPDDRATLERMAKGIDPMWVARVSRPPVGVCCEHLTLSTTGDANRPEDIDAAAEELGVILPPQLRALLLNYNLGHLRGGPFIFPRRRETSWAVDGIVCMVDPDFNDETTSHELTDRTEYLRETFEVPDRLVYLAEVSDEGIVVSCRKSDSGTVLHWDGYEQRAEKLANSVGEFLSMLIPKAWPLTDDDFTPEQ